MGPWALIEKDTGELVGFCGVGPEVVDEVEEACLGYRLAKRYWNQGLASEASQVVLNYVFAQKQLASVVVLIEPDHIASLRVAEKLGFKDFEVVEFHGLTVRLYRLACDDWQHSMSVVNL